MSDSDQSLYTIRYNQVTQGMEGFGGGSPTWTPLQLAADGGVMTIYSDSNPLLAGSIQFLSGSNITLSQTGQTITVNAAGSSPAGSSGDIQFNNSGSFGGDDNLSWNGGGQTLVLGDLTVSTAITLAYASNEIRFASDNGAAISFYNTANSTSFGNLVMNPAISYQLVANDSTTEITLVTSANSGTQNWHFRPDGSSQFPAASLSLTGSAADASAVLDLRANTSQGLLPPTLTSAQKTAISSPAEGLVVYDLTLHKLCVWTGSTWETVTSV